MESKCDLRSCLENGKDVLWRAALKKFQSFMKAQKRHAITSAFGFRFESSKLSKLSVLGLADLPNLFMMMNIRGTSVMPKNDFVENLVNLVHSIRKPEAASFANAIDFRHTGLISLGGLISFIEKQIGTVSADDILAITAEHPVFSEVR